MQYHVYLANLDPTIGHEIRKTRPCLVVSPNEMNEHLSTVIIAPMTTKSRKYPTRIKLRFGGRDGWIVLDQLRTVDRRRLVKELGLIDDRAIREVKAVIKEMLVD